MPNRSPKYLLAEERLGSDLGDFLNGRRKQGVTFERIARELWTETSVDVTSQTIANWCADLSPAEQAS